ncbi:MAG: hypothetical protein AABY15_07335, partial [Nanoarchaeota archaeon]
DQPLNPEPVPNANAITTQAIVNQGFFSKIFNSIINTFRTIFGLKTVGVSINQYVIYKYEDSSSITGEMLYQGSLTDFNCQETCSYTYTEDYGTYTYSVVSRGSIEKESARTNAIEIKEPQLKCDSLSSCPQDFICSTKEGICVEYTECPELISPSPDFCKEGTIIPGEVDERGCQMNLRCVLETVEKECDQTKLCIDTNKECDLTTNKCIKKTILECSETLSCADSNKKCVNNVCVLKIVNPPVVQNNTNQTNPGNNTNTVICVNGAVGTQACLFDIGICQKQGVKKGICQNNALGNFGECEPIEKCNIGSDCESGICDMDIHSCLPVEFEGSENGEVSCEDSLDNDCDGVSDCEDEDCDCFIPNDNADNLDTNPSSPNSPSSGGSSGGQNNNNLQRQQDIPRNIEYTDSSREGLNELGNERDVSGRFQDDTVGNTQSSKKEGSSLLTVVITFIIVLIFGAGGIYLYMFKFKKYKKQDIIMWVEHCRNMINEGKSISDVTKEMNSYNLPQDFIKKIVKKLK